MDLSNLTLSVLFRHSQWTPQVGRNHDRKLRARYIPKLSEEGYANFELVHSQSLGCSGDGGTNFKQMHHERRYHASDTGDMSILNLSVVG